MDRAHILDLMGTLRGQHWTPIDSWRPSGSSAVAASAVAIARKSKPHADAEAGPTTEVTEAPKPVAIRAGTKQAQIIALLQRPEGASIAEIVEATGWLSYSVRGVISGGFKKKLGFQVISVKEQGRGSVYRIG